MAMKRGGSKPSLASKLRNCGSTAPSVKGGDETKKVLRYKPNGGYLDQGGACCYVCHCSEFKDEKACRGHCSLIQMAVSKNAICSRFKK